MKKINLKNNKIKKSIKEQIKKLKLEKNKFNALELILIFIMALLFGIVLGELIFSGGNVTSNTMTKTHNANVEEIEKVYNTILEEYNNEVDEAVLKEAAIKGMIKELDDNYSIYYDEESSEVLKEELTGEFYGMGAEIYKDENGSIKINKIFQGSPAEKAGLKKEDEYFKINGEDITKKTTSEIANLIKGKDKKTFTLTVKRNGKEITTKVTTAKVEIPTVESEVIEKDNQKIGYVKITLFASNTDEQFEKHLAKLDKQGITKLIIDVRDNVGGELETVVNIASSFLNKDDVIIQRVSKTKTTKMYSTKNNEKKYDVVILMNKGSASGSEVLAATLNENYNADLIGTTTFGKGTVQKTQTLSSGSIIKYTIETWKTGKGKAIDGKGVKPTIEVKQNEKYYKTYDKKDDAQYQKAIKVILEK